MNIYDNYKEVSPSCLIIFTDGEGYYPENTEDITIPIVWIIDNDFIYPPFGKVIRLI